MKKRSIALLLIFAALLSLLAACGEGDRKGGGEKIPSLFTIPEGSEEKLSVTGSAVYSGEDELSELYRDGETLWIVRGEASARLDEEFRPGEWEVDPFRETPRAVYGNFALYTDHVKAGDKKIPLEIKFGEDTLGFWAFGGTVYLASQHVDYDPVEIEKALDRYVVLYPVEEAGLGDPVKAEGIKSAGMSVGSDGTWNYFADGNVLYRTDGEKLQNLGNVTTFGVNPSYLRSIEPLDEERVLLLSGKNLILLHIGGPAAEEDAGGRGKVTLGVVYSWGLLSDMVSSYNLSADDKVEVREYGSVDKLNLAILQKEVDMVAMDDPGYLEVYAARGLLAPLDTLAGEAISPDAIFLNILDVCRVGGEIYMIPDAVSVEGMLLPEAVVEKAGGRFEDMRDLIRTLDSLNPQDFYMLQTKENTLTNVLIHGLASWIDREKGECRFEDEDFLALLELCNRYAPDQDTVSANYKGKRVLFYPHWSLMRPENGVEEYFYEDVKGSEKSSSPYGIRAALFPAPTGKDAGFAIKACTTYGVLEESAVKKSAGAFLSWMLSEETQYEFVVEKGRCDYGMPIRISAFEKLVEDEIHAEFSSLTEEEIRAHCEKGRKILESADHFGGGANWEIGKVVMEEAGRYFKGEITAEKAAEYIQNRVSIYLAEQR
ncbi:MAG: carbohydrate ABC transporter substrate-binding protein [Clostridia bacterium]|nr:carbohydrate ABC transporter substrate-binding protein [Clostridia bacterium]